MRVLVASTFVPFVEGGGRMVASHLVDALRLHGHEVDTVEMPTIARWDAVLEQILAFRLLDVSHDADVLIAIGPPSHVLRHPNKRLWLIGHHHRPDCDLWGRQWQDFPSTPGGAAVRDAIRRSDELYLREAQKIFTNSQALAGRLRGSDGVEADVLYPPLGPGEQFFWEEPADYVFYPAPITPHKRQVLALEAASNLATDARVVIAGALDNPFDLALLDAMVRERGLERRVTLMPRSISASEMGELISRSLAVLYLAGDNGLERVALEASHARKAIITCTDSDGVFELVTDAENGLVVSPDGPALAAAIDRLRADPAWATRLGARAHELLVERDVTWDRVVDGLIA